MIRLFLFAFLAMSLSACIQQHKNSEPTVTVSIVPQQLFVNKIAGSWLTVNVMIPPGGNPHTYEPTPMQMKALSNSSAYFLVGPLSFETAWADKLASVNPDMKFFNTSDGINLIGEESWGVEPMNEQNHEHDHNHGGSNPHIWLTPELVKIQATNIYKALKDLYPTHGDEMKLNLERFTMQCDSIQQQLNTQLENAGGVSFIVYHPVWSYLAREYNLNQIAIEHNGKEATANKLKDIIDFANKNNIRIIFVQQEFSDAQARTIANEINGMVITLDPLNYNWFNTMTAFGHAFESISEINGKY